MQKEVVDLSKVSGEALAAIMHQLHGVLHRKEALKIVTEGLEEEFYAIAEKCAHRYYKKGSHLKFCNNPLNVNSTACLFGLCPL